MTTAAELAPVHRALLDRAQSEAAQTLAEARAAAAQHIADAQRAAADILARARNAGASDAEAAVAGSRRQVRGEARDVELAAQRAVYDDLLARVTASVEAELTTPAAQSALHRLIHDELGGDAEVTGLPCGGAVGAVPGRRLEISARRLADHGLARCAGRVRELWTS